MVVTDGECHYILDAFTGVVKRRLSGHNAVSNGSGDETNFTPDGQFVVGGTSPAGVMCSARSLLYSVFVRWIYRNQLTNTRLDIL